MLRRNDEIVPLERKTAQVLHLLLERPGRVVEKQEMNATIWPETFVEERNIAQHVYTLRKVLGKAKDGQRYIETAPRRGYRFVAAVSEVRSNGLPDGNQSVPGAVATGSRLSQTPGAAAARGDRDTPPEGIPLAAATTNRNSLPLQPNAMIGREGDLTNVMSLMLRNDVRLVTLTGAPGSGKTRLAIGAATELKHEFPEGGFLVELASIRDPNLFASALAGTLGLKETGSTPLSDTLKQHLKGRRMLLLLDNFEHLLPAALLLADLLS